MQNDLFQTLFLWESLALPVITLDGDTILYRNEWAALRFPSAAEGADIRTVLGEIGVRKLEKSAPGDDLTLLVDGISYDTVLIPAGTHRSLVFVGSRQEYRFSGYHELALLVPDLREIVTDLLTCTAMLDGASASVRGILLRNVYRLLRKSDTLRILTELRVGEMQLTPTLIDLRGELETVHALWQTIPAAPTLNIGSSAPFRVFFDRKLAVLLLCRLLTLARARCTDTDTITAALSQEAASFTLTVTDTGRPYEDRALSVLNCAEAFHAAECRLPSAQALDAAVIWMLTTSLGGSVHWDKNRISVTLPCAPNVTPTPADPTMQMEYSAGAGVDPIKAELAPLLPSAAFEG